jgi:hypothetical protein
MLARFFRIVCLVLFTFSFLFFSFAYDLEKNINSGNVPLPPDAQRVVNPDLPLGGPQAYIYTTSLDKNQLVSFFKDRLAQKNWSDQGLLSDKLKGAGISTPQLGLNQENPLANQSRMLQGTFRFQKGQVELMLMVLPKKNRAGQTIFSLIAAEGVNQNLKPQDQVSVKKNSFQAKSVPIYPGSNVVYSAKKSTVLSSSDQPKEVISYYKTTMPGRGWSLVEEEPLQARKIQSSLSELSGKIGEGQDAIGGECPSCEKVKELGESIPDELNEEIEKGYSIVQGKLIFNDSQNNRCMVSVTKTDLKGAIQGSSLGSTTINIIHFKALKTR